MSEIKQWIPCSERLPDKNGSYIAQIEESDGTAVLSFIVIDHCNEDGTWLHDFKGKKNYRKTIAWMPLPEPYSTDAQKPQTNADRIRNMTDEELTEWITNMCEFERNGEPYKSIYNIDTDNEEEIHDSYGDLLRWLKAESEE